MAAGQWIFAAAMTSGFALLAWLIAGAVERTEAERTELLRFHAERDPLTGLFNRRRLDQELARWTAETERHATPCTLLLCDLDNLKLVNDTLGHQAGDEIIKAVAETIGSRLRETDVLARIGGDEFAVLLPHTDVTQAGTVAESLRCAVSELTALVGPRAVRTTLSIGVAGLEQGRSVRQSTTAADTALYDAKRHGRNRVATSSPGPSKEHTGEQLSWLEHIRTALAENRFELHAQPITELRTGEVRCLELLIRLRERNGRMIMPTAFIPIAERFGLIAEIDRWVICAATRLAAQDLREIRYTVNLSATSIGDPGVLGLIDHEIRAAKIDPGRLTFEFTETAVITDLVAARAFTTGLARIGCASALDDFGAGFSSFSYLKDLRVDYLKIDGEFIRNLSGSPDDRVLVKAIIDVAHGLHKQTIAEFVGDAETLELLRDYGVDYAQGFHLGPPLPLAMGAEADRSAC